MKHFAGGLLGLAVGDALGVPVEFSSRQELHTDPVTGLRSGGTWQQEAGTWSDDTSMALALTVSLAEKGLDYGDMMARFARWLYHGEYTARGVTFDMGNTTRIAIDRYLQGTPALKCGPEAESNCGNGALMRILPLAAWLVPRYGKNLAAPEAMEIIHNVSALTHGHMTSKMGCGIYVCIAARLLAGEEPFQAVQQGTAAAFSYYETVTTVTQRRPYDRVWDTGTLIRLGEEEIRSTGYVADTLEAALWCFLTTDSYAACVLKAVNLGDDTDTTGAVAGGLAGLYYGEEGIPGQWREKLAKADTLRRAACRLEQEAGGIV